MKTKLQSLKTEAREALVKGMRATESSMAPGAPGMYLPNTRPSSIWQGVNKEDIGSHFKTIILDEDTKEQNFQRIKDSDGFNNRFLLGRSKFISFDLTPKFKVKKKRIVKPINLFNKLSKEEKIVINKKIGKNIEEFANFFMDILPITLSIPSASQKVDELVQQITGERANLPMSFVLNKTQDAVSLLVIRMISKKFKLTKRESTLMLREYLNVIKV